MNSQVLSVSGASYEGGSIISICAGPSKAWNIQYFCFICNS